jgi:hypothetical protein
MATFCIYLVDVDGKTGWVVRTTHDDGTVDTSIRYETRTQAQAAADSWTNLDEDWARV